MSYRATSAEINLKNLDHNLETIFSVAGKDRFVCPMIKADAYGHGAVRVAQHILKNYSVPLGVALVEEALELRKAGITSEIIVFGGFNVEGLKKIIEARLTAVVSNLEELQLIVQAKTPVDIHIKFNTGMNRLGFNLDQVEYVMAFLQKFTHLKLKGILSHLHTAHLADQQNSKSQMQAEQLLSIAEYFKNFKMHIHLLNSDAIACLAKVKNNYLTQYNWGFRPGIMMYGYVTSSINSPLKLKPVMTLKSQIQYVRVVKKEESVSYDATWIAPINSVIGIVPIGYADGVHRILSNRGRVLVSKNEVPIRGRVCMDFVMVDLTELQKKSDDLVGSEVLFFGEGQGADVVALAAETISYEMLTSVSARVPREYV